VRVLVTGGGGFAGRHLLRELILHGGARIHATVLGEVPGLDETEGLGEVEWSSLDLGSAEAVRELVHGFDPDLVYHLGGQASVGESFESPLRTWDVNATGTYRIAVALAERGSRPKRLLLVSSAEVYGVVDRAAQPLREDALLRPISPYGSSKVAAEVVALQTGRLAGLEVIVVRSFNHIGPGQDERFVLPSIALQLARIKRGLSVPIVRVGNVSVERDFLDVRDVARAYSLVAARGVPGTVYNIASGVPRTLLSIIQRLVELSGTGAAIEVDPVRVRSVDIPLLLGDAGRLHALGWRPRWDLDGTLGDLLRGAEALV